MLIVAAIIIGWLHLVAAAVLVGGDFFVDRTLWPVMEKSHSAAARKFAHANAERYVPIGWIAGVVLVITGLIRMAGLGALNFETLFASAYGNVLLAKIGLVAVMSVNSVLLSHESERLSELAKSDDSNPESVIKVSTRLRFFSRANLSLGIIIILLAVALRAIGVA